MQRQAPCFQATCAPQKRCWDHLCKRLEEHSSQTVLHQHPCIQTKKVHQLLARWSPYDWFPGMRLRTPRSLEIQFLYTVITATNVSSSSSSTVVPPSVSFVAGYFAPSYSYHHYMAPSQQWACISQDRTDVICTYHNLLTFQSLRAHLKGTQGRHDGPKRVSRQWHQWFSGSLHLENNC